MQSATKESGAHERRTLVLGAAYALLGAVLVASWLGLSASLSLLIGGSIALFNFWVMARAVSALLQSRAFGGWALLVSLKLLVLGAALYWLFKAGWVSALPFVIGLGAVPVGIAFAQLFAPKSDLVPMPGQRSGAPPG